MNHRGADTWFVKNSIIEYKRKEIPQTIHSDHPRPSWTSPWPIVAREETDDVEPDIHDEREENGT